MLKPIIQLYPVLATKDEAERVALRPVGRNVEKYQEALEGWKTIVKAADEMGLWGAATIEHHFWSEGYEVGPRDRKSTRLNSSHVSESRMPSSA